METAITGSVSPSAALDPVALPSASRSKRGASIAGIPSFGGPPDLISANGSVRFDRFVGQLLERLTQFPEDVVVAFDRIFRLEDLRLDVGQPHLPAIVLPREYLHR